VAEFVVGMIVDHGGGACADRCDVRVGLVARGVTSVTAA